MTKDEYLKELRARLTFRKSRREVKEILTEYSSFFETGLKDGRTEEGLCESFGSPKELAFEITGKVGSLFFIKEVIIRVAGLLLLVWINLFLFKLHLSAIVPFLSGISLWFLLGGGINFLPPYLGVNEQKYRNTAVLNIVTFLLFILATCYHFITVKNAVRGLLPNTSLMLFVLYASVISFLIIALFGLHGFICKNVSLYSVICHALGGLCSAICFHEFYFHWSDPEIPLYVLLLLILPYITGVLTSIVSAVFISRLNRKGNE